MSDLCPICSENSNELTPKTEPHIPEQFLCLQCLKEWASYLRSKGVDLQKPLNITNKDVNEWIKKEIIKRTIDVWKK